MKRMNLLTAFRSEDIDVTTVSWTWTNTRTRRPIGIHCNAESTIVGALINDAEVSEHVLQAGSTALSFRTITTASTTKNGIKVLYGS
ncbi:MAG: hypothetical protein ACM3ZE_31805 [Myxococcales bacterium]